MKKWIICVFAASLMGGCATMKGPSAEEILTGMWKPEESVAVYEIAVTDDGVQMSGHSEHSGKRLQISDVSWDGDVLRFTSYLASTNMKVVHENRIKDAQTMISRIVENKTGQLRSHTVTWKKQRPGN
ncbi:hypothetical protein P4C99_01065 [Pontiellaceae bacterium B1224]|nr:hypothetical protein [Pontiellaceae bacterium B1224]